jgi:hypothetical protein
MICCCRSVRIGQLLHFVHQSDNQQGEDDWCVLDVFDKEPNPNSTSDVQQTAVAAATSVANSTTPSLTFKQQQQQQQQQYSSIPSSVIIQNSPRSGKENIPINNIDNNKNYYYNLTSWLALHLLTQINHTDDKTSKRIQWILIQVACSTSINQEDNQLATAPRIKAWTDGQLVEWLIQQSSASSDASFGTSSTTSTASSDQYWVTALTIHC